MEAFRRASGYEVVNLWGASYGTLTAQRYIRKHGAHVRVAILDGAVSPAKDLFGAAAVDGERAMQIVLEECRSSKACTAQFGDLETRLHQLLSSFDTPRQVQLRDPLTGEPMAAVFTRDLVAQILRGALYTAEPRTLIPHAIAAASLGKFEPLAALAAYTAAWAIDTMAMGATLSVLCADQMPHQQAAGPAELAGFAGDSYRRHWTAGCAEWPHNLTSAADRTPLQSTVPVLILSGGLDPVTPPSSGDEVATQFERAAHAVMPDGAHNVSPFGCAPELMSQFLDAGSAEHLDYSCLQSVRRLPLVLSAGGPSP
jgi:pimeloyl-ACP methyl ester carboxylesterase